jgi:hypothetical protein
MSKKNAGLLAKLYLIGMALVAVGFICPIFANKLGSLNGFKFVTKNSSSISAAVILIFIGAVAGIVLEFISVKNSKLLKLVALVVSILGGVILFAKVNDNAISKFVGNQFLKNASIGFYLIIVGWICSVIGWIKAK